MLSSSWKRFCVIVILVFSTLQYLSAVSGDLLFEVGNMLESTTRYRYRYGEHQWELIEDGQAFLELHNFHDDDYLVIQKNTEGNAWDEERYFRFDGIERKWHAIQDPLLGIRLNVTAIDDSFSAFRYQTGVAPSTEWKSVESGETVIELPLFDPTTFLFLQQSKDGKDWGEVYRYQYDEMTKRWNSLPGLPKTGRSITPYGMMLGTTESFHHLYEARYGGGVEYMQESPFHQQLLFAANLAASGASLNNIWMDNFLILEASLGLGYRIPLSRQLDLVPSVAYGMLVHMGTVDFANDGSPERVCYIDQQLRASLDLAWTITETMKMVIKPEAVVFFETNQIGMQYGLGAGLQFAL
nr:hypothetical protein [uncultured Sphaerochaeta sp.]